MGSDSAVIGGHDILALERFMDDTRHMIIFDVLTWKSTVGDKGERLRLLLRNAPHTNSRWTNCWTASRISLSSIS